MGHATFPVSLNILEQERSAHRFVLLDEDIEVFLHH